MLIWLPFLCLLLHLQGSPSISLLLDVLTQISQSVVAPTSGLLDVSPNWLHLEDRKRTPLLSSLSISLNFSLIHTISKIKFLLKL